MKPEQQRIAIAKACGWMLRPYGDMLCWYGPKGIAFPVEREHRDAVLPNYLSDLNAMHEVEDTCISNQELQDKYTDYLCGLTGPFSAEFSCAFATASQRAEAFLRTLNLWKD